MTAGRKNSLNNCDWNTPPKIVDTIKEFWEEIDLDPCSNKYSIVNANYEFYVNGLEEDWSKFKTIFVNPPFGKGIKKWFQKSLLYKGSETIFLVPVATNTSHWKECVFGQANAICFLFDARLKFYFEGKEYKKGAPMACCLIYYGKNYNEFKIKFSKLGNVIIL